MVRIAKFVPAQPVLLRAKSLGEFQERRICPTVAPFFTEELHFLGEKFRHSGGGLGPEVPDPICSPRSVCDSAWNKDPVFGVIGIQSGPRG